MFKLLICITAISILLGCGVPPQDENKATEVPVENLEVTQSCNSLNFGFVFEDGINGLFYLVKKPETELYDLKHSTGDSVDILTNDAQRCFWYSEEWIYYISQSTGYLSKINVESKEEKTVLEQNCLDVVIIDNVLYFVSIPENQIFSLTLDTNQLTLLHPMAAHDLLACNGEVYFSSASKIYKVAFSGEIEPVLEYNDVNRFVIVDGIIYFTDNLGSGLYAVKLGTSDTNQIVHSKIFSINVRNRNLVFTAIVDGGEVKTFEYNTSTQETNLIHDFGYGYIGIANNMVYELAFREGTGAQIYCLDTNKLLD